MINYHKGIQIGALIIENKNGLYLLEVAESGVPTPVIQDGKIIKYENNITMLTIGIRAFGEERKRLYNKLLQELYNTTRFKFLDEEAYTEIKVIQSVDKMYAEPFLQVDITIEGSPYKFIDVPTAYISSRVENRGNYLADTLLEFTGNATVNGITVTGATGAVFVDSSNMTAYQLVNSKKVNALQYVNGEEFLKLSPGNNSITHTGASVKITYKHTFLW